MEQTNQSFLATEKLGRLMQKYAVPCIISLLVGALYNIVDQIFIANADYLGSYGNAANTVIFPLTVIALAIAVMIGDGYCAFVSLSLGKKTSGGCQLKRGKRHCADRGLRAYSVCHLSSFSGACHLHVRRHCKCRDFPALKGIFLLYFPWDSLLHV